MANISEDSIIHATIEKAFRTHPWRGVISVEQAIADAIAYRAGLNPVERARYDEQVVAGRHPIKALETIEILGGRDVPHGSPTREEVVIKVS
jgi:hypothetical protein